MRLIDADALLKVLNMEVLHYADNGYDEWLNGIRDGLERAMDTIEDTPAVDAEPVRHGAWIVEKRTKFNFDTVNIKCSECNTYFYKKANYCPNCGAKMDGGKQDAQV